MPGNIATAFTRTPEGIILHATRSGQASYSEIEEWEGTVNWVRNGVSGTGLGWHITAGPDRVAIHMPVTHWGWNARYHSGAYLAIEFAQPVLGAPISDETLDSAAWWINEVARAQWPNLPLTLVHHSELPAGIRDGKTDVAARATPEAEEFRQRVLSRL